MHHAFTLQFVGFNSVLADGRKLDESVLSFIFTNAVLDHIEKGLGHPHRIFADESLVHDLPHFRFIAHH
jgi:hypothetical protein